MLNKFIITPLLILTLNPVIELSSLADTTKYQTKTHQRKNSMADDAMYDVDIPPKIDNLNANKTTNATNFTDNLQTKTLNSFASNKNLILKKITNFKYPQQKAVTTAGYENHNEDAGEETLDDIIPKEIFSNDAEFYKNIKRITLKNNDDGINFNTNNDTDNVNKDHAAIPNEDKMSRDNNVKISNCSNDVGGNISTTDEPTATIATTLTPSRLLSLLTKDKKEMQNLPVKAVTITKTQARNRAWKLLKVSTPSSSQPSLTTPQTFSAPLPTSKSLTAVISGRKKKLFKKKYKKFLFPLLLAYKLKFLALTPAVIGGLILLVGTTGMAGFFFALFTAVMSLNAGSRNTKFHKTY